MVRAVSKFGSTRGCSRWGLWSISTVIEFMLVALETYRSTSEVILDARSLSALWFRLFLYQLGANLLWSPLMKVWNSTAKIICTHCRKKFFLGSQKLLITITSSNRTVLKLTRLKCHRSGTKNIFEALGTSKSGHSQLLISVPLTLLSSLFWRGIFQLFPTSLRLMPIS